jgi:hypothetical protein
LEAAGSQLAGSRPTRFEKAKIAGFGSDPRRQDIANSAQALSSANETCIAMRMRLPCQQRLVGPILVVDSSLML